LEQEKRGAVTNAERVTGVPGVAFGVVQDGKVVFSGEVGVRELGRPAKVDADTKFMIASNTESSKRWARCSRPAASARCSSTRIRWRPRPGSSADTWRTRSSSSARHSTGQCSRAEYVFAAQ
jgi:hypothetical protein